MKKSTKIFITLFALIAWGTALAFYFTPIGEQKHFQKRCPLTRIIRDTILNIDIDTTKEYSIISALSEDGKS